MRMYAPALCLTTVLSRCLSLMALCVCRPGSCLGCIFARLVLVALVVDEQKGDENDRRADPVYPAGVLRILNHLADERQRDCQRQADRHHQRRCEQHGVCPRHVADKRRQRVADDNSPNLGRWREGELVGIR